jgi:hypothetical protein
MIIDKGNCVRIFAVVLLVLFLTGCASSGPMQTKHGLINTQSFDTIFIESTNNRVKQVRYKKATVMYRGEMPAFASVDDTLVIADLGIFLVEWDTTHLRYIHKLELPFNEIESVEAVIQERSILPNSQQLKVTTSQNEIYHFMIFNGSVDRAKQLIEAGRSNN